MGGSGGGEEAVCFIELCTQQCVSLCVCVCIMKRPKVAGYDLISLTNLRVQYMLTNTVS
jgi:hypothetical protein